MRALAPTPQCVLWRLSQAAVGARGGAHGPGAALPGGQAITCARDGFEKALCGAAGRPVGGRAPSASALCGTPRARGGATAHSQRRGGTPPCGWRVLADAVL